jgi:hypothetical protein
MGIYGESALSASIGRHHGRLPVLSDWRSPSPSPSPS